MQGGQGINVAQLALVFGQAVGFVALIALVGTRLIRHKGTAALDAPINPLSPSPFR